MGHLIFRSLDVDVTVRKKEQIYSYENNATPLLWLSIAILVMTVY